MESPSGICKTAELIIHCDTEPFVPRGLIIVSHILPKKSFEWDAGAQEHAIWLSERQKKNRLPSGKSVLEDLCRSGKPVLNACALDQLLAHPDASPKGWRMWFVIFWGTIYEEVRSGYRCVRYLGCDKGSLCSGTFRLDAPLNNFNPAALHAN